jgi:hypothetical protein
MPNPLIARGSEEPIPLTLVLASDHRTGASNVAPSVWLSRDGAPFQPGVGALEPVGFGHYLYTPTPVESGTPGWLIVHAEAAGADPFDLLAEVAGDAPGPTLVRNRAQHPLPFLMVRSLDHVAGAVAAVPSVVLSKAGSAWAAPIGVVAEVGFGWYKVAPRGGDRNRAGPLLLHATAAGCDPSDAAYDVAAPAGVPGAGSSRDGFADLLNLWPPYRPYQAPPPAAERLRDDLIILAIADALRDTGVFGEVGVGSGPDDILEVPETVRGGCFVYPTEWSEETDAGGPAADDVEHRAGFDVLVYCREDSPEDRLRAQFRCQAAVMNMLGGRSLAGATWRFSTQVTRAESVLDRDGPPESWWRMTGRWAAIVSGWDGRDEAEDRRY